MNKNITVTTDSKVAPSTQGTAAAPAPVPPAPTVAPAILETKAGPRQVSNDVRTLKTYRRRQIVHVCLGKFCAGLPKAEAGILEDARVKVAALLDTRTQVPLGALVELADGTAVVWPLLDRKTLRPIAAG